MGQLIGKREWETLYHGWNWADVVSDMGYVRDDGKTMVAQPHLELGDQKKMWTLDHLRRMAPLQSPNVILNEMSDEERAAFHAQLRPRWSRGPVRSRASDGPFIRNGPVETPLAQARACPGEGGGR